MSTSRCGCQDCKDAERIMQIVEKTDQTPAEIEELKTLTGRLAPNILARHDKAGD